MHNSRLSSLPHAPTLVIPAISTSVIPAVFQRESSSYRHTAKERNNVWLHHRLIWLDSCLHRNDERGGNGERGGELFLGEQKAKAFYCLYRTKQLFLELCKGFYTKVLNILASSSSKYGIFPLGQLGIFLHLYVPRSASVILRRNGVFLVDYDGLRLCCECGRLLPIPINVPFMYCILMPTIASQ